MVRGRTFPWEQLRNASCLNARLQPHLLSAADVRHLDTVALAGFMSAITLPLPRHVGQGDMSSAIVWAPLPSYR